jgi:hypothetical protein
MQSQRVFWVAIAAAAWLLVGGISQSEVTTPEAPRQAGYEVLAACPAVPNDTTPIAGLHTAWAIDEPSAGGIRLLFADHPLACRRDSHLLGGTMDGKTCTPSWQFAFTLSADLQKPGTYNLNDYEADYADSVVMSIPSKGCSGGGCMGGGSGAAGGAKGPDSTIEIYSVTDECVTGRILRLERGVSTPPPPDFTGTFQAVRCTPESQ